MRILVTGSEGSLMRAVVPKLIMQGHTVIGVDNLLKDPKGKNVYKHPAYRFIRGDLTDYKVAEYAASEADSVIQAAARIYGVGGFNKYRADILGEDIAVHNNVLKAAAKKNITKVTYVSSSMVYERAGTDLTESDELKLPYTDYGLSKLTCERLSQAFFEQYGIKYTIWRPFNIITPYENASTDVGTSHVFADFIQNIVYSKLNPLPIIGDGEQIRCFTWIGDVAEAIAEFQSNILTENKIFNLGREEPVSMKHLANIIKEEAVAMGLIEDYEIDYKTVSNYPNDVMTRIPNCEKARTELKWEAQLTLREAIKICLETRQALA